MVLRLAHENDAAAVAALHKMALYLGRGMRIIASICAPDEIVVVGEVTMAWPIIDSIIEAELRRPVTTSIPKVRPSYDGTLVRLRSAMALILNEQYQHLY
jgi:predicted NBD/HSP70 family sugar kinase